jgi:hypothetical protein
LENVGVFIAVCCALLVDNELSTLQAKIDKVEDKVEKLEAAEPNENKEEYARWDKKMEQLRTKEEQLRTKEILLLEMRKQQQAQQGVCPL